MSPLTHYGVKEASLLSKNENKGVGDQSIGADCDEFTGFFGTELVGFQYFSTRCSLGSPISCPKWYQSPRKIRIWLSTAVEVLRNDENRIIGSDQAE